MNPEEENTKTGKLQWVLQCKYIERNLCSEVYRTFLSIQKLPVIDPQMVHNTDELSVVSSKFTFIAIKIDISHSYSCSWINEDIIFTPSMIF